MSLKHKILASSYPVLELYNSFTRFTRIRKQGRLRVLVYHDISPDQIDSFAAQLRWLARKWKFITPEMFSSMLSGEEPIVGDNVLLTFDDGFISNRIVAEKVLHEMGISAIFFVVSGFVEISGIDDCHEFIARGIRADLEPNKMPIHWQNMNWDDLRYLLDAGHTIGGHTATHARLSLLKDDVELDIEIIKSADLIETKLGINIEHFAFTFGDFSSLSCDALNVAKQRFKYIHTSLRGKNTNNTLSPALIYRDTISPLDNNYLTGAFLAGGADILYKRGRDSINRCTSTSM